MNTLPLISVVMPCYNAAAFIEDSIRSVLQQTYAQWELIIINDGSTDETAQRISAFSDNRIRLIQLNHNHGIAYCRNLGIQEAKGKYICWLDADDIALPNRLQQQVSWLEQHPDTVLCAMQAHIINEQGQWQQQPAPGISDAALKAAMFFRFPFINSTVAMPTAAARQAADTSVNYKQAEDYILYSRLMQSGRFVCLPHAGIGYRIHQSAHRITDDRNNADIVHGRMIAWRQQLSYWQLTASHEVLLLHDKLCYYRQRITATDMACADNYLELLAQMLHRNTTSQLLDANTLAGEISSRVYSLLIHAQLPLATALRLGFRYRHLMLQPARQKLLPNKLRRWLLRMPH